MPPLGCQKIKPRARQFLNAEQIKLLAQKAVIPLGSLFQPLEMLLHLLCGEECRAVDPLQLRILLVAQPVGAREARDLHRFHPPRRRHVRPAAKV